jgi:16S rRNA processing protein RimM
MSASETLEVGLITGLFGTSGEVKVFLHNPESEMFQSPLSVELRHEDGKTERATMSIRKGAGKRILGRFSTITTRNVAESMKGVLIFVRRKELPPLKADEFYVQDLVNAVIRGKSGSLGQVHFVHSTAGGDLLEVRNGREVYFIPLADEFIEDMDLEGGVIVLTSTGEEAIQ